MSGDLFRKEKTCNQFHQWESQVHGADSGVVRDDLEVRFVWLWQFLTRLTVSYCARIALIQVSKLWEVRSRGRAQKLLVVSLFLFYARRDEVKNEASRAILDKVGLYRL